MKKVISLLLSLLIIFSFALCSCSPAELTTETDADKDQAAFDALREKVASAGYDVSDAYVDASFNEVVSAFSVKVNFDANTIASIPIVLTKTEEAAIANCEMFGENSIKKPIRNGKIFSYPGKDYPENVLVLVDAIVNNKDIPANTY